MKDLDLRTGAIAFCALLALGAPAAAVEIDSLFGDHMVLQAGVDHPLWGRGVPGETVTVEFAGQAVRTVVDHQGRWTVRLAPLENRSVPTRLIATGSRGDRAVLEDVLVGEVWLCAGQSNMAFPLRSAASGADALEEADSLPGLRILHRAQRYPGGNEPWSEDQIASIAPETFFERPAWQRATRTTAADFSAVGFFFGRYLGFELATPVGLINVAVGGTPTEAWIPRGRILADPDLAPLERDFPFSFIAHPFINDRPQAHLRAWVQSGRETPVPGHFFRSGFMHAAAIEPMKGLPIAGVLWYQGESNAHDATRHRTLLALLIDTLRESLGDPDLPLLQVQLPGLDREEWPEFRESQAAVLDTPGVAMVTAFDLGHPTDVHPHRKKPVGERLARLALEIVYRRELLGRPPMLAGDVSFDGSRIEVTIARSGSGLRLEGDSPARSFWIAGEDRIFRRATWVDASGDRVRAECDAITEPAALRFAWEADPFPALRRIDDDMPVAPFRTDNWKPVRIACIGDSITHGHGLAHRDAQSYPAHLSRFVGPLFDVRNFGRSGTNIIKRIKRAEWDRAFVKNAPHERALAFEPDVVVVNLGINDVPEEGFDLDEFVKDYLELIDTYRALRTKPAILIWHPLAPLFEGHRFHDHPRLREVNAAIARVARIAKIPTIDMLDPLRDHPEWFPDFIHPNSAGARAIACRIHDAMRRIGLPVSPISTAVKAKERDR